MGMRKQFSNEFKAKVAMEAIRGSYYLCQSSLEHGHHLYPFR